jgi:hypothetical protein
MMPLAVHLDMLGYLKLFEFGGGCVDKIYTESKALKPHLPQQIPSHIMKVCCAMFEHQPSEEPSHMSSRIGLHTAIGLSRQATSSSIYPALQTI